MQHNRADRRGFTCTILLKKPLLSDTSFTLLGYDAIITENKHRYGARHLTDKLRRTVKKHLTVDLTVKYKAFESDACTLAQEIAIRDRDDRL